MNRALRTVRGISATAALAATCTTVAPAIMGSVAQAATTTMRATTDVNVRSAPDNSGRVVTVALRGQSVKVTGPKVANWVPVNVNGRNGYIYQRFLTSGSVSSHSTTSRSSGGSTRTSSSGATGSAWTTTRLNLRSSGSLSARVQTVLPQGTKVNRTGTTSGSWVKVTSSHGSGWVHNSYLRSSKPSGSTSSSSPSRTSTPPSRGSSTSRGGSRSGVTGSCTASYYDEPQMTASGERFNPDAMTAAHKTLPLGTRVKVTNTRTGASTVVRINDRGPYIAGRCLDLSRASFAQIANTSAGVTPVSYTVLG